MSSLEEPTAREELTVLRSQIDTPFSIEKKYGRWRLTVFRGGSAIAALIDLVAAHQIRHDLTLLDGL